jgi:hypothetical protein
MALDAVDWVEIGQVFKDSLDHVLKNAKALEQKSQERIIHFVYHNALYGKPFMLVTPMGVKNLVENVFSDVIVRDFVLQLSFVFYSRWGTDNAKYSQLAETLAFAVSADVEPLGISGTASVPCSIPPAVLADLPKTDGVRATLASNKWLSVVLLIALVVQMPETPPKGVTKK